MPVDTVEDMFVYQLEEMYGVENELIDVLDDLAAETANEEMTSGFADHQEETQQQLQRLDDVFDALDMAPDQRASATLAGGSKVEALIDNLLS